MAYNLIVGGEDPDEIDGTEADDRIEGLGGEDWLDGEEGDDLLIGGHGDDVLFGGPGDDEIWGGLGRDTLFADEYVDGTFNRLYGGAHADLLLIRAGVAARVFGGRGVDTLSVSANSGDVELIVGPGSVGGASMTDLRLAGVERIEISVEGAHHALVTCGEGRDSVNAKAFIAEVDTGAGNDVVGFQVNGQKHWLNGGEGFDLLVISVFGSAPVEFLCDGGIATDSGGSRIEGFERYLVEVQGNTHTHFRVGDGNDFLYGGGGTDRLEGAGGRDQLRDGDGDDFLFGGSGADLLSSGDGVDALFGGAGRDSFYAGPGDALKGGAGDDILQIWGSGTMRGGRGADRFQPVANLESPRILDFETGIDVIEIPASIIDNLMEPGRRPRVSVDGPRGTDPQFYLLTTEEGSQLIWDGGSAGGDFVVAELDSVFRLAAGDLLIT